MGDCVDDVMSYVKCINCRHSSVFRYPFGGILISCEVTGCSFKVDRCPIS